MVKKKTSINVDDKLWTKWLVFVTQKTGTSRKVSEEIEKALQEYMEHHKN